MFAFVSHKDINPYYWHRVAQRTPERTHLTRCGLTFNVNHETIYMVDSDPMVGNATHCGYCYGVDKYGDSANSPKYTEPFTAPTI